MATWVVREEGGSWTVRCGRVQESFTGQDDALDFVRRKKGAGDRVEVEESDGYRVPLKPRKHWRS